MSDDDEHRSIRELIADLPASKPKLLGITERLRTEGRLEEAHRIVQGALEAEALPELHLEQARILLAAEAHRRAVSAVEPLFAGTSDPPGNAFAIVAKAKHHLGEDEQARRFLLRAKKKGADDELVEDVRAILAEIEVRRGDAAPEGDAPPPEADVDDETMELSSSWVRMVRATFEHSDPAADDTEEFTGPPTEELEDPGADDLDETEPLDEEAEAAAEQSDDSDDSTLDLGDRSEITIPETDDWAVEGDTRESDSFWVAPTDPETTQEDLFTHGTGPGDEATGEPEPVDFQTDEIEAQTVGPHAVETDPANDAGDTDRGSRTVSVEPIDQQPAISPDETRPDSPRGPEGRDDSTRKVDREALRERVERESPPGEPGRELKEFQPPSDEGESNPTEPEIPSASGESDRWEPGDVLHAEPAPTDSGEPDENAPASESVDDWEPSEESTQDVPDRSSRSGAGRIVAILTGVLIGVVGIALGLRFYAEGDVSRLESELEAVEELEREATFASLQQGLERTNRVLDASKPGETRRLLHQVARPLLTASPERLREKLGARRAYLASLLEFRFEQCGSRSASELADAAETADGPRALAGRVYRHLACGRRGDALDDSRRARKRWGESAPVADARLAALLATEQVDAARSLAEQLRGSSETPSAYREYLLAAALVYTDRDRARERFRELAGAEDSDRLDARLASLELAAERGEVDPALEEAESLEDAARDDLSSYQRARLQRALGRIRARMGEPDAARKHFEQAFGAVPKRTEMYLPGIDFELVTGHLRHARRLLSSAEERAPKTPELRVRRADYLFRSGAVEEARRALPGERIPPAGALLRARIELSQGRLNEAREHLSRVPEGHPLHPDAAALEQLVAVHGDSPDLESALEGLQEVRSQRPDDPALTEYSVRAHLVASAHVDTERGRTYLDRALEEAKVLSAHGSYAGLGHLLTCRAHLAKGELESASEACRRAREATAQSTRAALASARTAVARGAPEEARSYLEELPETAAETWVVDAVRIRSSIASGDYDAAREALDSWADRSDDPRHRLLAGRLAFARGDYERAAELLSKSADSSGHPVLEGEARLYLAHARVRLGNDDEVAPLVQALTDLYRWKRMAWVIYGELRRRQGNPREALENLQIARRLDDFPRVRPDREVLRHVEFAKTWRDIRGWNHRHVSTYLDRASEHVAEDSPSPAYEFARGLYEGERWQPNEQEAVDRLRRGLESQPHRCEMLERLENFQDRFDLRGERRSVPEAADEACSSSEKDSNSEG